jgi:hypothetical protein
MTGGQVACPPQKRADQIQMCEDVPPSSLIAHWFDQPTPLKLNIHAFAFDIGHRSGFLTGGFLCFYRFQKIREDAV